jgi:hypothetical protein
MPAMRVSLTARYVSHPIISFGPVRGATTRGPRLGPVRPRTTFHRPRLARLAQPTVAALRAQATGFTFPSVSRPGRLGDRRVNIPLGSPRARRA